MSSITKQDLEKRYEMSQRMLIESEKTLAKCTRYLVAAYIVTGLLSAIPLVAIAGIFFIATVLTGLYASATEDVGRAKGEMSALERILKDCYKVDMN